MKITIALSFFLLATVSAKTQTVLLDSYFNNEHRPGPDGKTESWHYKWEETDNGGFSLLADMFREQGAKTNTSYVRPTPAILDSAAVYILVDPDIPEENPDPNYIEARDAQVISDWVKNGGVLVLMGNDPGNAEFNHFNRLAEQFGIRFNQDRRNHVEGHDFATGALTIPKNHPVFRTTSKIYMKDICTLHVEAPAKPLLTDKEDVIMAVARFGRGTVFAVGDPWLYNEYTDGKILPAEYQNLQAANDLVKWLLSRVPAR
ncbi:MAG TPA: DUF4350 domain-containing protein [Puia sp.]|nr:DUF4350 domain-containing protein [Puia sp.]